MIRIPPKSRHWTGLVIFFSLAGALQADVVGEWVAVARATNSGILGAHAEFRAATAKVPQVKSLPDPRVEFETMGADSVGAEQTVRLAQAFPWPGTLGQRESVSSLQARAYWHEIQAMELAVISRIRTIAAEMAYLRKESSLVRQNIELFVKQEEFLEQVSRGGGEVSDLVRVEMQSGLLSDDLAKIDETFKREKAQLEALIGRTVPDAELRRLPASSKVPPLPGGESLAVRLEATNPTLQALASRVDAAHSGVQLARLATYPELMLSAGYRRVNEPSMGGNREWMNEAVVMFSIGLPIWGEKNRGVRNEAEAVLDSAIQEREATHRMLRARLETLLSRHRDATRRAALFNDRLLPRARQVHEALESSYRAGQASLPDVFDARRRLLETETGYWRAIADAHITDAEIDALFGTEIQIRKP
jgi:cobalt-zinc-cadmium efflux system outer membrane protein